MAQQSKAPPILKDGVIFSTWRHELDAWVLLTETPKAKQAIQIYLNSLEGKYRELVSKIPIADLNKETGVKTLVDKLSVFCEQNKSKRTYAIYEKLHDYRRKPGQSVSEALMQFDSILSDFTGEGMQLPEEVMAFHVLKAMDLPPQTEGLARATIETLDYNSMIGKIQALVSEPSEGKIALGESIITKEEPVDPNVLYSSARGASRGRGRGFRNSNNTPRRCYICNSSQHMANNCPKRKKPEGVTCFKCGKFGHFARDCPDNNRNTPTVNITLFQSTPAVSEFLGETFGHAVIDTACKVTLAGSVWVEQYLNTLSEKDRREVVEEPCDMSFRFGDGVETKARSKVVLPVNLGGCICKLDVAVIDNDLPLLLSIKSMQKGKMVLDYNKNTIKIFGKHINLKFTSSGHSIIPLTDKTVDNRHNIVLHVSGLQNLNKQGKLNKMKKLHIQFSHASKEALWRLLLSSGIRDTSLRDALGEICDKCDVCVRFKNKPLRPCVTEPLAEGFNCTVAMDLKTVVNNEVYILHFICLGTKFSAACIIKNKNQNTVVKKILSVWVQVFGAPRRLLTDNGGGI